MAYFSGDAESAARVLTEAVARRSPVIRGTTGDVGITDSFAEQWCRTRQVHIVGKQAQRIYRLDRVNEIPRAPGRLRLATMAERDMLAAWQTASAVDIYGVLSSRMPAMDITPAIQRQDVFVWEDGVPVSMAGKTRPTENAITIDLVFTPPEFRRRGYATSCVSSLCTELLSGGYKFCTLYTDLANPTSNSICKKIGFNEVSDSVEYSFSE